MRDDARVPVAELAPERCSVCAHIHDHGWTGLSAATHCRRCHSVWGGSAAQHCVGCCRTFSSISAADAHRRGGECHDPATVLTRSDEAVFGTPGINGWGVSIWSLAPRDVGAL
jgi:hypothetical protein